MFSFFIPPFFFDHTRGRGSPGIFFILSIIYSLLCILHDLPVPRRPPASVFSRHPPPLSPVSFPYYPMIEKNVESTGKICYTELATQIEYFARTRCIFTYGKNASPLWHPCTGPYDLCSDNRGMRFSVCSSDWAAHFFVCSVFFCCYAKMEGSSWL